jgi:hypothetical protein
VQVGETPVKINFDVRGSLYRGAFAAIDFGGAGLAPDIDHFARHFDMALHA